MDDLANRAPFKRKIKAVVACGNGTAGAFAPQVLARLGLEVVPLNIDLDYNFPNHNPNPEDLKMLHAHLRCGESERRRCGARLRRRRRPLRRGRQ